MVKILYAEDDAMQARTCIDYLKRAGYKVVHATDGFNFDGRDYAQDERV